jgi:hypothetical protein
MSILTTALEFFLVVAFLCRPLWRVGAIVAFAFAAYLEFLLRPGVFAWDTLAALILFMPAADRGWQVVHDFRRPAGRWSATVLSGLDWLRRLRWTPSTDGVAAAHGGDGRGTGLRLVSPSGRIYNGVEAFRMLPIILPGPFFVGMAMARFGGGFLGSRGYGPWYDLPFLVLALWLLLWVPGFARFVAGPVYTAAARGMVRTGRR